ncbi:MAG: tetratricopeptide repeat protein [Nitrospirae bacterium]|nr:tetratricopeptide repeat protein [Nitrospirota bacterium]
MQRTRLVKYSLAAATALLTFIVYLPALRNEFVNWDDMRYIVENPDIRSFDAAFFRWAFLGFHIGNWHPLTWISHALDYAIWGLNPLGHHLTNIILHAVNTAFVVVLALKLLDFMRERSAQNGAASFLNNRTILIAAGATGLLFGIHPVHVESVAWVAERKDLLCALFFLLSIIWYAHYVSSKTYKTYMLTLGFFVLALMSKPMAVSLPVVLLILDWHPFSRIRSLRTAGVSFVEKLPFILLSIASSVLTILAQRTEGAMASTEVVPLSIRMLVAAKSLILYLGKMIVPMDLIPFYPYPKDVSPASFAYLSTLALMIAITAACVIIAKRNRSWLSAWGYYVVTLLPALGIVQVGAQAMADRYTYLPSLGPFLIIGSIAAWTSAKIQERWGVSRQRLLNAGVLLIFGLLSYATIQQTRIWHDSVTFWSYELEKEPDANIAYVNRGEAFAKRGQLDKAIRDFTEAISRKPSDYKAFYNRGILFSKLNLVSQALADYSEAIALKPSYYDAYNSRGALYAKREQFDKALADYTAAISIDPSRSQAYMNRGLTYDRAGQVDKARADFDKAIALDPNNADAYYNRGLFFNKAGRLDAALADLDRAITLNPGDPDAYYNRGVVFQKTGQVDKADQDFLLWKEHSASQ